MAITGAAPFLEPWSAIVSGAVGGGIFYCGASAAVVRLGVDDAVDAFAVHGAAGIWGTLLLGLFGSLDAPSTPSVSGLSVGLIRAPETVVTSLITGDGGEQLLVQLCGLLTVAAISSATAAFFFGAARALGLARVSAETEARGMDAGFHVD